MRTTTGLGDCPYIIRTINFDRQEIKSREYDRGFIEGPQADAVDVDMVKAVAEHIPAGMSPEKCLQYLDLAEYSHGGLLLRRAALLLFARDAIKWHPRLQIRIMRVAGTKIGTGRDYNVIDDQSISGNILTLIERGWEGLRRHLVQTRLGKEARFHATFMYPEYACREALVNSIAHRDYSQEGRGIEIYVFQDRMEITNPGGLLSTLKIDDLLRLEGVDQSRNTYVSRVLRELGYMRELGEGVRRIFDLMKRNELSPPELVSGTESFKIVLSHRPIYSQEELLWLDEFTALNLDREQKAIVLLGRGGKIIKPQDIWDTLGLVDTEHYRRLVASLQKLGILKSEVDRNKAAQLAKAKGIPAKQIPRFRVEPPTAAVANSQRSERPAAADRTSANATAASNDSVALGNEGDLAKQTEASRVYVGNLARETSPDDLYILFKSCGMIEEVHLPEGPRGGKGYGFVEFSSSSAAEKATREMAGVELRGRRIIVRPARVRLRS